MNSSIANLPLKRQKIYYKYFTYLESRQRKIRTAELPRYIDYWIGLNTEVSFVTGWKKDDGTVMLMGFVLTRFYLSKFFEDQRSLFI
jgi:hypothetical protein